MVRAAVSGVLALALAAGGAEPPPLSGLGQVLPARTGPRGQLLPWSTRITPGLVKRAGLTPALQQRWERQLQRVAGALRKAPVLTPPLGFHAQLQGSLEVVATGPPATALLAGCVRLWAWGRDPAVKGKGGVARPRDVPSLEVCLNEPPEVGQGAFSGAPWMKDGAGAFFPLRTEGELQGFPIHGGELWLPVDGASPFRPVSRGRLIEAFLKAHPQPTGATARLVARYAALRDVVSPEALAGPAWVSDDPLEPALVNSDVPGAMPVMEVAPGFLSPRGNRAQVQVLRVHDVEGIARSAWQPEQPARRVYLEVLQGTDWKALSSRVQGER